MIQLKHLRSLLRIVIKIGEEILRNAYGDMLFLRQFAAG